MTLNDTKAPNKAPAYDEVARGAGSLGKSHQAGEPCLAMGDDSGIKCPHCQETSSRNTWPFCSYCRLFVVPMDELDLSPRADLLHWHDEPRLELLN
jgi:hypothetical protein